MGVAFEGGAYFFMGCLFSGSHICFVELGTGTKGTRLSQVTRKYGRFIAFFSVTHPFNYPLLPR